MKTSAPETSLMNATTGGTVCGRDSRAFRGPATFIARFWLGRLLWICLLASTAYGANTWSNTGSLAAGRALHTSSLLPNGKVLVVGNIFDPFGNSSEVFDPATGGWSITNTLEGRYLHTATVLPSGKVLLVGGDDGRGTSLQNAELYDSATGTSSWTGSLTMNRGSHTATLLPNGKVLVAGATLSVPLSPAR